MDSQCKKDIVECGALMSESKLVNAYEGNISIKKDKLIYITPARRSKKNMTEDMVTVIDTRTNTQVGGLYKASSEYLLHENLYLMREDAVAVIHCHSPYLTAFAVCGQPVVTKAYPEMIAIYGEIPVAPYGRPGTADIYAGLPPIMKNHDVALLSNHGVVAVGKNVWDALHKLEAAEAIAKVLLLSKLVGTPKDLPDSECDYLRSLI